MPMALHVSAKHLSGLHVQGGEERGGSVALVIMGLSLAPTFLQRKAGQRPVQRLYLGLLIDAEDYRMGAAVLSTGLPGARAGAISFESGANGIFGGGVECRLWTDGTVKARLVSARLTRLTDEAAPPRSSPH